MTTDQKLAEDVLALISASPDGKEAISSLLENLQRGYTDSRRRWKGLTRGRGVWAGAHSVGFFEERLRELGFTVQEGRNSRNQTRTEVSL